MNCCQNRIVGGIGVTSCGSTKLYFYDGDDSACNVACRDTERKAFGESGSAKTSLALAILRLINSEGQIRFNGDDLQALSEKEMRGHRSDVQIVIQDLQEQLVLQILRKHILQHR